jgi:futalosine hydrolase
LSELETKLLNILKLKALIVSSTEKETNLLIQKATDLHKIGPYCNSGKIGNSEVDFLIAGIGLPSVIYRLTNHLCKNKYDLIINPGIAGSFKDSLKIGSVVYVTTEQFGDLGIDDNCEQKTLFDMGFTDQNSTPYSAGKLLNNFDQNKYKALSSLQKVNGITINMASGNQADIDKRVSKFLPDIETMEGAGVFYTCLSMNIPFIEIRAISNKIEPRNVKNWNIPLAITSLSSVLLNLFSEIG